MNYKQPSPSERKRIGVEMVKNAFLVLCGAILGSLVTFGFTHFRHARSQANAMLTAASVPPFTTTLYRFELKPDKLNRFEDWIQFEHAHHAETVATLERERMYFEAIFRDHDHEKNVIYWLTIQGQGGGHTDDSPLPIDKRYEELMQETLKKGSRTTLSTEYSLVPPFLVEAIQNRN